MTVNSVNSRMTALHREMCDDLDAHVPPLGFNGTHGESTHSKAKRGQCMCGHPDYVTCPDYVKPWPESVA